MLHLCSCLNTHLITFWFFGAFTSSRKKCVKTELFARAPRCQAYQRSARGTGRQLRRSERGWGNIRRVLAGATWHHRWLGGSLGLKNLSCFLVFSIIQIINGKLTDKLKEKSLIVKHAGLWATVGPTLASTQRDLGGLRAREGGRGNLSSRD